MFTHQFVRDCLSIAVLFVVMATCGTKRLGRYFDDIGAVPSHSFHLPLLTDVIESGIHSWSFGASTVLTDEYVRLSPAVGEGHGYLWNQYPSDLKSWSASFTLRVYQRPHSNGLTPSSASFCGVAFWTLKEPTRHGDSPFFGVPSAFVGAGVVVRQDGSLHLVGRDANESPAQDVESVSHGRCTMKISGDLVNILVTYSAKDKTLDLAYSERGGKPVHCASGAAEHLPEHYYLGFTSYTTGSSPMGYDVLGMAFVPLEGAQERPIDLAEQKAATAFDHAIDENERDFWAKQGDTDPDASAPATQDDGAKVSGRDIPHHAQLLRNAHHQKDTATDPDGATGAGETVDVRRFRHGGKGDDSAASAAEADLHSDESKEAA